MTRPPLTIDLTKPEARLCREAAKLAESALLPAAGANAASRGDWHDMARWLSWLACDFERSIDLDRRRAAEKLSARLEAIIERFNVVNPPGPVKAAAEKPKQLVMF